MKRTLVLLAVAAILLTSIAHSQTMTVKTKGGDKIRKIGDISNLTFGKLNTGVSIRMVLIPGGTFVMGQMGVAQPVHSVTIKRPFYIGSYEISQKEYKDIIGSYPGSFAGRDSNAVDCVSWYDAVIFCNRLSKKEGLEECYTLQGGKVYECDFNKKGYRLPTEAEWEYACRAGTVTDFYTGSTTAAMDAAGWFTQNSKASTHPVGQKQANAFGVYDMHGNVYEWCWDWLADYSDGPAEDPSGPVSGSQRVLRGGSWNSAASSCRSAFRSYYYYPDGRSNNFGFRVARTQ